MSSKLIQRPIIILAAPRSGSSLLLQILSAHSDLWSLYEESHDVLAQFHPSNRNWESNVLTEADLDESTRLRLERSFYERSGNLERLPLAHLIPLRGRGRFGRPISALSRWFRHPPIRIVEKTPHNALRIPFLRALFPDAQFLHLTRDPRTNIPALYRSWLNPDRYLAFPLWNGFRIEGFHGSHWAFILPPRWRELNGRPLADICAVQWRAANEMPLEHLEGLPPSRVLRTRYEDLMSETVRELARIATWAELDPKPFRRFSKNLPRINATRSRHAAEWTMPEDELDRVLPMVTDIAARLGYP
ncbi:MAG: sulfotransferase family protein [Actinomycetota bacterium]